jgi:hypothetical protein
MSDEHERALAAFLRTFDKRMSDAPVVDRRQVDRDGVIEARRAPGPVVGEVAYWVKPPRRTRH